MRHSVWVQQFYLLLTNYLHYGEDDATGRNLHILNCSTVYLLLTYYLHYGEDDATDQNLQVLNCSTVLLTTYLLLTLPPLQAVSSETQFVFNGFTSYLLTTYTMVKMLHVISEPLLCSVPLDITWTRTECPIRSSVSSKYKISPTRYHLSAGGSVSNGVSNSVSSK